MRHKFNYLIYLLLILTIFSVIGVGFSTYRISNSSKTNTIVNINNITIEDQTIISNLVVNDNIKYDDKHELITSSILEFKLDFNAPLLFNSNLSKAIFYIDIIIPDNSLYQHIKSHAIVFQDILTISNYNNTTKISTNGETQYSYYSKDKLSISPCFSAYDDTNKVTLAVPLSTDYSVNQEYSIHAVTKTNKKTSFKIYLDFNLFDKKLGYSLIFNKNSFLNSQINLRVV